jgi:CRISPR-associated protein Cas5/CasD subtype I-E
MTTHVLRFAGPLQVWPDRARFSSRPTLPTPTFSAVSGFLHACLGRARPAVGENWALHPALADALIAVRVDGAGTVVEDLQTINPLPARVFRGDPKFTGRNSETALIRTGEGGAWVIKGAAPSLMSTRQYLSDAVFTVFVEPSSKAASVELAGALHRPAFTPYLGRKSCVPTWPWSLGRTEASIEAAADSVPVCAPGRSDPVECELHHLHNPGITGWRSTNTPTTPLDRPGGRYSNRTVQVTKVSPDSVGHLTELLNWAATNLTGQLERTN